MSNSGKRILFVLTNHDRCGDAADQSADKTGFHLFEAAAPWHILTSEGVDIDFASPHGGTAPIDPGSLDLDDETNRLFMEDERVKQQLADTQALGDADLDAYDAIYFPGGHGTMWDLPDSADVQNAIRRMYESGKAVAAVCHGPAALVNAKLGSGHWLVDGKTVSVFTDDEERAVGKAKVVPFLLAAKLVERGAILDQAADFEAAVSVDGNLITGQNPASARGVGEALRDWLNKKSRKAA